MRALRSEAASSAAREAANVLRLRRSHALDIIDPQAPNVARGSEHDNRRMPVRRARQRCAFLRGYGTHARLEVALFGVEHLDEATAHGRAASPNLDARSAKTAKQRRQPERLFVFEPWKSGERPRAPRAQAARKFDAGDAGFGVVRKDDERLQRVVEVARGHGELDASLRERPRAFEVADTGFVQAHARKGEWRRVGAERGRRPQGGGRGTQRKTDPR